MSTQTSCQPSLYLPHGGGPCFFMDWTLGPTDSWDRLAQWLRSIPQSLPQLPRAIVVISAHWEAKELRLTAQAQPPLRYDYDGFPEHTYALTYPVPGAPDLAREIQQRLSDAGFSSQLESERGLDHGVFIPFKLIFPEAQIPIVQLSLLRGLDPEQHLRIGKALQPLRAQNVLIAGSGMSFHNLRALMGGGGQVQPQVLAQSQAFDHWLEESLKAAPAEREEALIHWQKAPYARFAHPREEHLLPLMVAVGAAASRPAEKAFSDQILGTHISGYSLS